jgi:hypothetical protein
MKANSRDILKTSHGLQSLVCHGQVRVVVALPSFTSSPPKQYLAHNITIHIIQYASSEIGWISEVNKAGMILLQHFVHDLKLIETHQNGRAVSETLTDFFL